MEALVALLFPILRPYIVPLIAEVIAFIVHKRQTDPVFLAESDLVFSKIVSAKTKEEKLNATTELQALVNPIKR